jgi:hypothetical protein
MSPVVHPLYRAVVKTYLRGAHVDTSAALLMPGAIESDRAAGHQSALSDRAMADLEVERLAPKLVRLTDVAHFEACT